LRLGPSDPSTALGFTGSDNYGNTAFDGRFSGRDLSDFLLGVPYGTNYASVNQDNDGMAWHYVQRGFERHSELLPEHHLPTPDAIKCARAMTGAGQGFDHVSRGLVNLNVASETLPKQFGGLRHNRLVRPRSPSYSTPGTRRPADQIDLDS
jgi:hypothetical protein